MSDIPSPSTTPGTRPAADPVAALRDAAFEHHRQGRLPEAIAAYLAVLRHAPDITQIKNNLALALLANGDYERGLRLYEIRFERETARVPKPTLPMPEWKGEDLAGRSLLVWPEQGFGDQIMYARFARVLHQRGVTVTWVTPPPLAALFRHLPATVVEHGPKIPLTRHDAWCMAGSLALRLGVTVPTLPARPYLPSWPTGIGTGIGTGPGTGEGIGVMLAGRAAPDPGRSLTPEAAAEVMRWPGVVSLAPEDTGAADFEATRAIIQHLACVVTVDTAVAHLAGAMGKPTCLMLPATADWRWMQHRTDSPWYPSMRLFRQATPGDWAPVVAEVRAALAGAGA